MKKTIIILMAIVFFSSCSISKSNCESETAKVVTSDFISLTTPQLYDGKMMYLDYATKTKSLNQVNGLKHDMTLLHSLTDILSSVTVYKVNNGGSITFLGNTASKRNETYKVIYDFSQTQTIKDKANDSIKLSVGVSVRMIAEVTTHKKNIDLTDIFKIGLNADEENVSGTLTVRSVGISSQKVNQSIPVTTDLSPASIAAALQSVATIKSRIYETDTVITPHIVGFSIGTNTDENEVEKSINKLAL